MGVEVTHNDRFKASSGNWYWSGIALATVLHFVAFAFWPDMRASAVDTTSDAMEAVDIPTDLKIPPPPQQIARPATPVVATTEIDDDITIAPTTFDQHTPETLPPPPTSSGSGDALRNAPQYVPMTVIPELKNKEEIARLAQREYPPLLRDVGIGGTVVLWCYIDEEGRVLEKQVKQSSGQSALDETALRIADRMRFSPAYNRDKRIQVWIEQAIVFTAPR